MEEKRCLACKKNLKDRWKVKYCSNECQFVFQHKEWVEKWKAGKKSGNIGISTRNISKHLKRFLIEKHGEMCSVCGWNEKHPKSHRVPLEIEHTDGNAENNKETNLRLLCPNCHSLTPCFKNFNKGRGRSWRNKKYIKNK